MITLDPGVRALIADVGDVEFLLPDGVRYFSGDSGTDVLERGDAFEVRPWGKGVTGEPELTGATREIVEVFLVLQYGDSWRLAQGWSMLQIAQRETALPAGFEIHESPDRTVTLQVPGPPAVRLGGMFPWRARELARALTVPLDDLISSFKDPDGRPAFEQQR